MYKLVRTTFVTEKLEFKNNHLKPGNFKLKPTLSRRTGKINQNLFFTTLILSVKNSELYPFPVDLFVEFRGIFEFKDIENESEIMEFLKIEAVNIMFPYLRSITTNLTTTALMPPIVLPIVDAKKLFKNDTDSVYIN